MVRVGFLVMLSLTLPVASPAAASQRGVNACTKAISDNLIRAQKAVTVVYTQCATTVERCLDKVLADQSVCMAAISALGQACNGATLNVNDPDSRAGKPIAYALTSIDKKCNPATVGNDDVITLGTGATNATSASTLLDTNVTSLGANVDGALFCSAAASYSEFESCLRTRLIDSVLTRVRTARPRVWWLLNVAGVSLTRNLIPLGKHRVVATTSATLNTYLGPVPLTGIVGNYTLDISSVDAGTGTAEVLVPAASTSFTSVFIPFAGGITVCLDAPEDGRGLLCCAADCTATMGSPNYTVNQDHESSGNNAALALLPGEVGPPDPTCTASVTNTIGGSSSVKTACSEDKAKGGACNAEAIGANNPNSHAPRCLGGFRSGRFCDPASAATDCAGGGGCLPPFTSCCPQSPAVGPLIAPACNGPATVIPTAGTAGDGTLIIGATIQFTYHSHTLNSVTYAGVGCMNVAGDSKPDSYGCDGIACTADDNVPRGGATAPFLSQHGRFTSRILMTTGTTSATVFDANLIPTGFGGLITTGNVTGAAPANACHRISTSVTTGYTVVAGLPALDDQTIGDTATSLKEVW